MTTVPDSLRALADFVAINVVAGAPDGHSKNISVLLNPNGERSIAPLYDLATGLAYDQDNVDRSVALSVGGERHVSRIRAAQWKKAAAVMGLSGDEVVDRVAYLAAGFAGAFRGAVDEVADVPGAQELADRALSEVEKHCQVVLDNL